MLPPFGCLEGMVVMKVINEKDYVYVCTEGAFHKFESNPVKVNYDKEYLLVERVRLIKLDGTFQFFDYVRNQKADNSEFQ